MRVTIHWEETASYTSTVEVDEANVWQYLRDEQGATGGPGLPEHLSNEDVERYVHAGESNWFEQVDTKNDYDSTTHRALLDVQGYDWTEKA